ncbi:hypothetical protein, partial [Streptomyces sp. NPDC058953]|uniref:hypothetical protein n=1 Tax=Streptomyces sp. NPDC058953 TaxID=3346676 RepID=UPI0036B954A8
WYIAIRPCMAATDASANTAADHLPAILRPADGQTPTALYHLSVRCARNTWQSVHRAENRRRVRLLSVLCSLLNVAN